MECKNSKSKFMLLFVLFCTILLPILTPITLAAENDNLSLSFDPRPNEPPIAPINPDPPDGSIDVVLPVTLSVDVYDDTGDFVDVYFYNASNDELIGVDYNVPSKWSTASVIWNGLTKGKIYIWYAIAKDFQYENKSQTWAFLIRSSQPSPPSGGGGGGYTPLPNEFPIAVITAPNIAYVDETIIFYAYYSEDRDGYIVGYRWDFENDGFYDTNWMEDILISYRYQLQGNYTVKLQVMDDDGAVTTTCHNISIIELETSKKLPVPITNGPYFAYTNEIIDFYSNQSYDPDGIIINYTWNFGDGNISFLENPSHLYSESGNYIVILKITDNDNLSNVSVTKAVIIIKKGEKPEEKEQPVLFIIILFMIIIATIIVFIARTKKVRFTLLVEKFEKSKKNKNKNNKKDEDIDKKIDKLLSKLEK